MSKNEPITIHTKVSQSTEVVASEMDDEVVMMSIEQGAYFGLDPVGSRIWEIIEKPVDVSALCDQLLEEFEVTRDVCEGDTLSFLNKLSDDKLLEVHHASHT